MLPTAPTLASLYRWPGNGSLERQVDGTALRQTCPGRWRGDLAPPRLCVLQQVVGRGHPIMCFVRVRRCVQGRVVGKQKGRRACFQSSGHAAELLVESFFNVLLIQPPRLLQSAGDNPSRTVLGASHASLAPIRARPHRKKPRRKYCTVLHTQVRREVHDTPCNLLAPHGTLTSVPQGTHARIPAVINPSGSDFLFR